MNPESAEKKLHHITCLMGTFNLFKKQRTKEQNILFMFLMLKI